MPTVRPTSSCENDEDLKYRLLGNSGLRVSEAALRTITLNEASAMDHRLGPRSDGIRVSASLGGIPGPRGLP